MIIIQKMANIVYQLIYYYSVNIEFLQLYIATLQSTEILIHFEINTITTDLLQFKNNIDCLLCFEISSCNERDGYKSHLTISWMLVCDTVYFCQLTLNP